VCGLFALAPGRTDRRAFRNNGARSSICAHLDVAPRQRAGVSIRPVWDRQPGADARSAGAAPGHARPRPIRRRLNGNGDSMVACIHDQQTKPEQAAQVVHTDVLVAAAAATRDGKKQLIGCPHAVRCTTLSSRAVRLAARGAMLSASGSPKIRLGQAMAAHRNRRTWIRRCRHGRAMAGPPEADHTGYGPATIVGRTQVRQHRARSAEP
jgi:hypothetical protein